MRDSHFRHPGLNMILVLALIAALLCIPTGPIRAGGWITADESIQQTDLEVVYLVDGPTITAVYSFGYGGKAHDFVWLIPLPSPPESFGEFKGDWYWRGWYGDFTLPMEVTLPQKYCDTLRGKQDDPNYDPLYEVAQAAIGDQQLLDGNNIFSWLSEKNFKVSDSTRQMINQYVKEGMIFLAVRMSQDKAVQKTDYPTDGFAPPFAVTYKSNKIVLPLRLISTSAVKHMPIQMWVLSDARYVPQNAIDAGVNLGKLRGYSQIMDLVPWPFDRTTWTYQEELSRTIKGYSQLAFVTQYAGPSSKLADDQVDVSALKEKYAYITRLYTEIPSSGNIVDPVLIKSTTAPPVSNRLDISKYVDPLAYWGCSTRAVSESFGPLKALPAGRIKLLGMNFAYPAGWLLSTETIPSLIGLEGATQTVYVLAPRRVSALEVTQALSGKAAVPMFLLFDHSIIVNWDILEASTVFGSLPNSYGRFLRRFRPGPGTSGVVSGVLTSDQDWKQHEAMYQAMLTYASQLPYYLHPELRYSLFLNDVYVGFPDGWKDEAKGDEILITSPDGQARVRIRKVATILGLSPGERIDDDSWKALSAALDAEYATPGSLYLERYLRYSGCNSPFPSFVYQHANRTGNLRLNGMMGVVVEISAPTRSYSRYEHILKAISDSLDFQVNC